MSLRFPSPRKRVPASHASASTLARVEAAADENAAVIETNDDAASCKRSCVDAGYFDDRFVQYFVPNVGAFLSAVLLHARVSATTHRKQVHLRLGVPQPPNVASQLNFCCFYFF